MARGQLPKAYLRIDPNLGFTHPDPGAFVRLLGLANAQPWRGRFKEWALIEAGLGRAQARRLRARGDVARQADGSWYLLGWDDWQEGDVGVGERMQKIRAEQRSSAAERTARWRERHRPSPGASHEASQTVTRDASQGVTESVTRPSRDTVTPSEASRRQGVKASTYPPTPLPQAEGGAPAAGVQTSAPGPPAKEALRDWSRLVKELKLRIPRKEFAVWFQPLRPLRRENGALVVHARDAVILERIAGKHREAVDAAMTAAGLGDVRLELVVGPRGRS